MIKNVRIGCLNYAIVEMENLTDEDGQAIYGQAAYDACEIRIWRKLSPQTKQATLWHEIIHAIMVNAGYVGEHDEQIVSAIAHGIYCSLIDNPDLVDVTS